MTLSEKLQERANLTLEEWTDSGSRIVSHSVTGNISLPEYKKNYLLLINPSPVALWRAFAATLAEKKPLIVLPPYSREEQDRLLAHLPETPPEEALLVLFSSGSTGEPKAVFHSEKSLLASAEQLATGLEVYENRACLLPAWGMAGIAFHFLLPLHAGGRNFFSAEPLLYWFDSADQALAREGVELLVLSPFQHAALLQSANCAWKGTALTLTAPMKERQRGEWLERHAGRLREIYGMTESAGPLILDGESLGAELRLNAQNELEFRGEQNCLGLANSGVFTPSAEWLASGDQFAQENGKWIFTSRLRELIDIGGRKIAPRLIEEIFEALPEISECLAFSDQAQGVERVGLVYVRARECKLTHEELAARIEKRATESLSENLRPVWWRELEQLPRLSNGKPNRKSLRFSAS